MNAGLLAGLGGFFQALGGDITKERDEERQDKRAEMKARLANKLQMDLLKAKMEYAKANPRYSHFVQSPTGDTIAMDEFGNVKTIQGSPEIKQAAKDKQDALNAYKQSQIDENKARLGLLAAQGDAAKARADKDRRYQPGSSRKPVNEINEGTFQKIVDEDFYRQYGKPSGGTVTAADAEQAKQVIDDPSASPVMKKSAQSTLDEWESSKKARTQIEAKLRPMYNVINTRSAGLVNPLPANNPFADLISSSDGTNDAQEDPDSGEDDVLNYE